MKKFGLGMVWLGSAFLVLVGCGKVDTGHSLQETTAAGELQESPRYAGFVGTGWWGWYGWGGASTVFGDYFHGLAQLRVATAQANYTHARAAQEWARAAHYYHLMLAARNDMLRIGRELRRQEKARERFWDNYRALNGIAVGDLNPRVRRALAYFSSLPGFGGLRFGEADGQVGPFGPEQFEAPEFVNRYDRARGMVPVAVEKEGFDGGTVQEFLAWLRKHPTYDVRVDTNPAGEPPTAWQILMQVKQAIQNQVALTLQRVEALRQRSRERQARESGQELWQEHGNGLLPDYTQEFEAADRLRE